MQHISRMWLWVTLLFTVSLLVSCETQGTSVAPVFVQTGDDLLLDVDADVPEGFLLVDWKFNKTVDFVIFPPGGEPVVFSDFTGRIEFPEKKFSVKLKNLQKADSGVYTARVLTVQGKQQQLAEHKVTVQDPVSPVELTVDPDTVSRSSDSCNLTATCRTQDSHISSTFRCVHRACSQEGGERSEVTTSGASLQVYLLNSSIICNHSNQVSWAKDFKMIDDFCPQYPDPGPNPFPVTVIVIIPILVIIFVLLGLFFYCRRRGNYKRENNESTIYEIPQVTATAQPQDESPTDDASGPTSTYSMVGPHTGYLDPSETRGRTLSESLYATVEKHPGSLNNS